MGIGVSIFLIAVGAILKFAVTATASGINVGTVGVILMLVGGLGILLSLLFWSSWGGWGGGRRGDTFIAAAPRETTTTTEVRRP